MFTSVLKSLSVVPPSSRYNASQYKDLHEALDRLDKHTVMHELAWSKELEFSKAATVKINGVEYSFTDSALYQLCKEMCPSLFGFIREIAGVYRTDDDPRDDYCFDDAIDILNRVISRRFDNHLYGKLLLKNTLDKTIDGVITPKYKWLSNLRLCETVKEAVENSDLRPPFHEAVLNGRWLLIRFVLPNSFIEVSQGDSIRLGYSFSNDEVAFATVTGAPMLFRTKGETSSINNMNRAGKLKHAGSKFESRLDMVIRKVMTGHKSKDYYTAKFNALTTKEIDVGQLKQDFEATKEKRKLARKLDSLDIPQTMAIQAVDSMLENKSSTTDSIKIRTTYDLYNALGREAKPASIKHREAAEQLAYRLLEDPSIID